MSEYQPMAKAEELVEEAQQILKNGNKIAYVKLLRGVTTLGLKEGKQMVEDVIMRNIEKIIQKEKTRREAVVVEILKYGEMLRKEQKEELTQKLKNLDGQLIEKEKRK